MNTGTSSTLLGEGTIAATGWARTYATTQHCQRFADLVPAAACASFSTVEQVTGAVVNRTQWVVIACSTPHHTCTMNRQMPW